MGAAELGGASEERRARNSLSCYDRPMSDVFVRSLAAFVIVLGLGSAGCGVSTTQRLDLPALQTVPRVELARYLGTWYEISAFPQRFQKGCTATRATYSLREDGDIEVLNRCRKGGLNGEEDTAQGRARVVDRVTNAKLEVSFFWPFWGDYWIIDLADDYSFAVVGHPSRDYLWVLSRSPTLPDVIYRAILTRLDTSGYETGRLEKTLQVASP
jgi:apolipoprotein D and lipocalin family protein